MADPDRTKRFLDQVLALAKAYALAGSRDEAAAIRNDARLFADVHAAILKEGVAARCQRDLAGQTSPGAQLELLERLARQRLTEMSPTRHGLA